MLWLYKRKGKEKTCSRACRSWIKDQEEELLVCLLGCAARVGLYVLCMGFISRFKGTQIDWNRWLNSCSLWNWTYGDIDLRI